MDEYLDTSPTATIAGLVVIAVGQRSPAFDGGLKTADVITAVNGQPVKTVAIFKQIIEESLTKAPNETLILLVHRGDQEPQAISIRPPTVAR